MPKDAEEIPLADFLAAISAELRTAHDRAEKSGEAVMKLQDVELEMEVETVVEGNAGVKLLFFKAGGGGKKSRTTTIRVKYSALGNVVAAVLAPSGTLPAPSHEGTRVDSPGGEGS